MIETINGYILGPYLADKLSLNRHFFDRITEDENFSIIYKWRHYYVRPSEQILNLMAQGYVARPLYTGESEKDYEVVIKLKRIKLGFWRK